MDIGFCFMKRKYNSMELNIESIDAVKELQPIEHPENLNKTRKEIGLKNLEIFSTQNSA